MLYVHNWPITLIRNGFISEEKVYLPLAYLPHYVIHFLSFDLLK